MLDFFLDLHPVVQALIATSFTWGMTALGAALVFATKTLNQKLLDSMLGFAGGVMIAASFWSLLSPALDMAEGDGLPAWIPAAVGFYLEDYFYGGESIRFSHTFILIPRLKKQRGSNQVKKTKHAISPCYYATQHT